MIVVSDGKCKRVLLVGMLVSDAVFMRVGSENVGSSGEWYQLHV